MHEGQVVEALARLREHYAEGWRGVVLREVAGGFTLATDPVAERGGPAPARAPAHPAALPGPGGDARIVAYLQPVSRPEIARIRGVSSDSAAATLLERGLIEESGRSQFGAVLYRTTDLFLKLFGLNTVSELPDISAWDPSPEEEARAARPPSARRRGARVVIRPRRRPGAAGGGPARRWPWRPSAGAQALLGRCPKGLPHGARCGHVVVPLDRSGAVPGQVSLFLETLPARGTASGGVLIPLAGGPGQAAVPLAQDTAQLLGGVLQNRTSGDLRPAGHGALGRAALPRARARPRR